MSHRTELEAATKKWYLSRKLRAAISALLADLAIRGSAIRPLETKIEAALKELDATCFCHSSTDPDVKQCWPCRVRAILSGRGVG